MRVPRPVDLFIAAAWLVNGLICKVLGVVPRHQEIVARVLGDGHAREITILIGMAEIGMAVWVLSGIVRKVNAAAQIGIVMLMNVIEFALAPDLLLFGRANIIVAAAFSVLVYQRGFRMIE